MRKYKIENVHGHSFLCDHGTVLDAALASGFVYENSCRNGQCGVCKTTLLSGEIKEVRPQIALAESDENNRKFLMCCCEPESDILIDAEDLSVLQSMKTTTNPAKISSINMLSSSVIEIVLRLPPNNSFAFLEGQYVDVIGPNAVKRSYSIVNSSFDPEIKLWIKKVENGVLSNYWFNEAKTGDLLRIEGPKGTFYIRNIHNPIMFLATGTGIAPVVSMLSYLDSVVDTGKRMKVLLFWGNRNPEDFVWVPHFNHIDVELTMTLSVGHHDWGGEIGYVQDIALSKVDDIAYFDVYACGSISMIEAAKKLFLESGLPENKYYSDAFVSSF